MNTRLKGRMEKRRRDEDDIPPMRILEPFRAEVIEFDDKNDFIKYVNEDMETYKSLTTQKLNKMFHIPGYRITKLQGDISHIPGYRITKLQGDISLKAVGGKEDADAEKKMRSEIMEEVMEKVRSEIEEKVKDIVEEKLKDEMENYEKELDEIHDSITKLRNDLGQLCKSLFPPE